MTTTTRTQAFAKSRLGICFLCVAIVALFSSESIMAALRQVVHTASGQTITLCQDAGDSRGGHYEQQQQQLQHHRLPPVHINSSWMGNQWMPPPGYRLYTTNEMQSFFRNHSIMFIGDSTSRRTYGTLYSILNETSHPNDLTVYDIDRPEVIDVNKVAGKYTEPCDKPDYTLCRHQGPNAGLFDFHAASCIEFLLDFLNNQTSWFWNDVNNYSLVVIIIGPHEVMGRCQGGKIHWESKITEMAQALVDIQLPKHVQLVWRTWGTIGNDNITIANESVQVAYQYNKVMMETMDAYDEALQKSGNLTTTTNPVSYIDWGSVIVPRSLPNSQRIEGDIIAHYGLEARLAFIQMLVNHLEERNRVTEY